MRTDKPELMFCPEYGDDIIGTCDQIMCQDVDKLYSVKYVAHTEVLSATPSGTAIVASISNNLLEGIKKKSNKGATMSSVSYDSKYRARPGFVLSQEFCAGCGKPLIGTNRPIMCAKCSSKRSCECCLDGLTIAPGFTCSTCGYSRPAKPRPVFTVAQTNDFDGLHNEQLEAILNTPNTRKIYQELVEVSIKDLNYGRKLNE